MKHLWLMRHAQPQPGDQMDSSRDLTPAGVKQAEDMGEWLRREHGRVDMVITSPFRRTAHTAEIMAQALGAHVADTRCLEPDQDPEDSWKEIERLAQQSSDVLAVGHGPNIHLLLMRMLGLNGGEPEVVFQHGAIAHIHLDPQGNALRWLVDPKLVVKEEQQELEESAIALSEALKDMPEPGEELRVKVRPVSDLEDGGQLWQIEPLSGLRESLRHPRHAARLDPLKKKLSAFLTRRWSRQQARLLKSGKAWLTHLATLFVQEALSDSDAAKLKAAVTANLNASGDFTGSVSDSEAGEFDAIVSGAMQAAIETSSVDNFAGVAQRLGNRFAQSYLRDNGFSKLAKDIDATSVVRLSNAVTDVYEKGGSYGDAVAAIKGTFDDFKTSRAETIARTELNDAYNSTMLDSAKEIDGAKKEWSLDGEGCPICELNADEGPIDLDDEFPSGDTEPTAHPNAVFAGSTFASYGSLKRMISAEYDGLAISLETGEYRTTIGPNHPLLTARGLIQAKFLQIGDQLIHDRRMLRLPTRGPQSDLNEVELVEDIMAALKVSSGYSCVSATADDFHGDVMFCENEVEVVFPKRELLHELKSGGLERLRKSGLVKADMQPHGEAGLGFLDEQLHRFLLSSAGGMSWSDVRHYHLLTIEAIRETAFKGRAFDATTESGLYSSDGFVVANCDCSLSIVLP